MSNVLLFEQRELSNVLRVYEGRVRSHIPRLAHSRDIRTFFDLLGSSLRHSTSLLCTAFLKTSVVLSSVPVIEEDVGGKKHREEVAIAIYMHDPQRMRLWDKGHIGILQRREQHQAQDEGFWNGADMYSLFFLEERDQNEIASRYYNAFIRCRDSFPMDISTPRLLENTYRGSNSCESLKHQPSPHYQQPPPLSPQYSHPPSSPPP
jgi:hypothetical protein